LFPPTQLAPNWLLMGSLYRLSDGLLVLASCSLRTYREALETRGLGNEFSLLERILLQEVG